MTSLPGHMRPQWPQQQCSEFWVLEHWMAWRKMCHCEVRESPALPLLGGAWSWSWQGVGDLLEVRNKTNYGTLGDMEDS